MRLGRGALPRDAPFVSPSVFHVGEFGYAGPEDPTSAPDRRSAITGKYSVHNLFRLTPDSLEHANYSASHTKRGKDYHQRFSEMRGRSLMWALEQQTLSRFLAVADPSAVVDLASGTGRIAGHMKSARPSMEVTGIDISESMLAQAKANFPDVRFEQLDGRQAINRFGPGSIDLVSAFRFFPNAEESLRASVADQISELVRPGGWVIINNHRNFWSPTYVLWRSRPRNGAPGALNRDIERLFTSRGFEVCKRTSLGVWPQSDERAYGLPWSVVEPFERFNADQLSSLHTLGSNTIWLFRKHEA